MGVQTVNKQPHFTALLQLAGVNIELDAALKVSLLLLLPSKFRTIRSLSTERSTLMKVCIPELQPSDPLALQHSIPRNYQRQHHGLRPVLCLRSAHFLAVCCSKRSIRLNPAEPPLFIHSLVCDSTIRPLSPPLHHRSSRALMRPKLLNSFTF